MAVPPFTQPRLYHQLAGAGRRTALKFYGLRDNLRVVWVQGHV
jgi:hypothetical protein